MHQKYLLLFLCVLFVGIQWRHAALLSQKYTCQFACGPMEVSLKIKEEYGESQYYQKYLAKTVSGDTIVLYIKKADHMPLTVQNEVWVEGEFCLPEEARNSGTYDERKSFYAKGVLGRLFANKVTLLRENKVDFLTLSRRYIYQTFLQMLPQKYASVITAMLSGEKERIPQPIKENFQTSGMSHLLAVSGMHVSYVMMLMSLVFSKIVGKRGSYYFCIMGILFYMFLTGLSLSVVRAGCMAILGMLAFLFSKRASSINHLMVSGLGIIVFHPFAIFDLGFLLSFLGTLGILVFSQDISQFLSRWIPSAWVAQTLSVSMAAQLLLIPIMTIYFHQLSLVSLLANLFVAPIVGLVVMLGLLMIVLSMIHFSLAKLLSFSLYFALWYMVQIITWFAKLPFASVLVAAPSYFMIAGYYLILGGVSYRPFRDRVIHFVKGNRRHQRWLLTSLTLASIIWQAFLHFPCSYIRLHMIDVGQGDAFYIETPQKNVILVDTGGSDTLENEVGERILIPYLLSKGKSKIHTILISHPHTDHIGGVYALIDALEIGQIIIGKGLREDALIQQLFLKCQQKKIPMIEVSQGDFFTIDGIDFEVLFPKENTSYENLNNMSLMVEMAFGGKKLLFTGDLEDAEESLGRFARDCDILKVGHHGSDTSTSEELLRKTTPQIALISVGKNNRYGHPKKEVLDRLAKWNVRVFRTDENGEIMLIIHKNRNY